MGWRSTFRGRPIYYVLPLILIIWFLDWRLGVILTGWCIWREPKWNLFGGSLAPINDAQTNGTILRHLLILPTVLVCIGSPLIVWALALVLLSVWVFWATYLACYNGVCAEDGEDVNWLVELARGAGFGAVAAAVIILQGVFT
jgi:hypothetical protein